MKKINKVIEKVIYALDEEDKKAIRRIYILLDEIHWDMSIDDRIEINEDNSIYFEFGEINTLYKNIEKLLEADFLSLTKEREEQEEVIK